MCKIFFTYRSRHSKELLQKFLETSITEKWKDGYGISWWKKHQWNTYKQPMFYSHDQNYQNVFDNIDKTNVIAAHLRYILTKDIPEHKVKKEKVVENTHPFEHENNIFYTAAICSLRITRIYYFTKVITSHLYLHLACRN